MKRAAKNFHEKGCERIRAHFSDWAHLPQPHRTARFVIVPEHDFV